MSSIPNLYATATAASFAITSSTVASTNWVQTLQKIKSTRFVPMKRSVNKDQAIRTYVVITKNIGKIDDYIHHEPALYFVENNYNHDDYGQSFTLFIFKIKKETKCYYILESGQRIAKTMTANTFAASPAEALDKSLKRARRYLNILIRRAETVSNFLRALDYPRKSDMSELRRFEDLAKQFEDPDEIPYQLLREDALGELL